MKKAVVMSLAVAAALNASNSDEAFGTGKVSGQIRAAYVSQNNEVDQDTYGTSFGGVLKYETTAWNDFKLGVGAYISQKIGFATGSFDEGKANPDLFGENTSSYVYLGEAYVDYSANDFSLRLGRQLIDTPFADTDEIRMHPNTFEAAIAAYSGIDKTSFIGGYIKRWAGYDSGDDISQFKKLAEGSSGAVVLGLTNESIENLAVQGWYYGVDKIADLYYADAVYTIPFSESIGLEISGQGAQFNEKNGSNVDGNVYGIGVALNVGVLTVGAAYNHGSNSENKTPPIGFGGGPYMTSMEEMTIEGMNDVRAYQLRAELDMADAGIEGLVFSTLYGDFKSTPMNVKVKEFDIIATYAINESISADISYAVINDKNNNFNAGNDAGYERLLARIQYSF